MYKTVHLECIVLLPESDYCGIVQCEGVGKKSTSLRNINLASAGSETAALAVAGRAVSVASSPPAAASAAAPVAPAAAVFAKAERRGGAGQEAMEFCAASDSRGAD